MQRVSVVGPSGSGKTSVAARISMMLELPHLELDSIHWQAGWTPLETEELRSRVGSFTASDRWVVDGNYSKVRDLIAARADTVVWLRHSRPIVMGRLLRRSIRRVVFRSRMWNGNTERLADLIDARNPEHLIRWSWSSFPKLAERYRAEMEDPELSHLSWIVLESPKATERFLTTLQPT